MIEKIYLGLIIVFFILAFAVRNIRTYLSTKQAIKGKSRKLTISVLLSTIIYLLILSRLTILDPKWIMEFELLASTIMNIIGLAFVSTGFVLGILALIAMKNSWRIGILHEQKTALVTSGIYRFSRNPYFLSYDLLIFGFILIFPSLILLLLYLTLVIIFHKMILEEEQYLISIHKSAYTEYKNKVNRYLNI